MPVLLAAAVLCLSPTVHDGDTIRCGRVRLGTDTYGRTLATVSVNGVDAGDYLIAQGLARPWR